MATGDKIVNLDELKAVYDKLSADITQAASGKVNKAGDTLSGDLNVGTSTGTTTRRLTVKSNVSNNYGEVQLRADNEGGNVRITKGNNYVEMDMYDGNNFRIYTYDDGGSIRSILWNRNTGTMTVKNIDANLAASKITGTLPIAHGGTGGEDAPTARTNLDVYSKSEVENLLVPKVYGVWGDIVKSPTTGTAVGSGKATVSIIGKLVRVEFIAKIAVAGSNWDVYDVGIQVANLRTLEPTIPMFTVLNGGNIFFYDTNGAIEASREGYSGTASVNTSENRWVFGRMHTRSGSYGSWSDGIYDPGEYVSGTLYGVIS